MLFGSRKLFVTIIIGLLFFLFGLYYNDIVQPKQITRSVIGTSELLYGLVFEKAEKDSMIDGLNDLLKDYKAVRAVELDNSIVPALQFNPIPEGWMINELSDDFKLSDYSQTKIPTDRKALAFYSIGELAHLIKSRLISSEDLTKFFLERLKQFGPKLECIITLNELTALEQARQADKEIKSGKYRGILHGIPFGIKDLFATKGLKTTWGAKPYEDQIINMDATVVKKLHEAGAVMVAKLTLGALAWGDVWFAGKTRNPWNTELGSSGSSAGSAAAVSAGLVPFAIGTETWGSIVSPSTVCGVTGLRPTYGRVSRYGAMALSWSMDKIGPICRKAEDTAIILRAISGPDGKDPSVYDYPVSYHTDHNVKNLRIGYIKSDFESDYYFKRQDSLTIIKLKELGIDLIAVELPEYPVRNISFILSAEAAAAFDLLTRSNRDDQLVRQIKNAWPNSFRTSRFIPAVEYINANRIRTLIIQEMAELFEEIDVFLAPSWQGNTLLLTNLTGHPAMVLPNGFDDKNLPTSFTIIGDLFQEGELVTVAKAFQDKTDYHKKHPVL